MNKAVMAYAKENGYQRVIRRTSWRGYEVYEPYYDGIPCIGLPYVILVKDGLMRFCTPEESMERLSDLPPEE